MEAIEKNFIQTEKTPREYLTESEIVFSAARMLNNSIHGHDFNVKYGIRWKDQCYTNLLDDKILSVFHPSVLLDVKKDKVLIDIFDTMNCKMVVFNEPPELTAIAEAIYKILVKHLSEIEPAMKIEYVEVNKVTFIPNEKI